MKDYRTSSKNVNSTTKNYTHTLQEEN